MQYEEISIDKLYNISDMNLPINGLEQPISSTSLIKYLLYVEEVIKERNFQGRFVQVSIKSIHLLAKYQIDYRSLVKNLLALSVIKEKKKKNNNRYSPNEYEINKSRLLISLVMCISINCFSNNTVKAINKEGFSFLKILNGIDRSIKDGSESLYHPRGAYEQKIVGYVYEFFSTLIHSIQIQLVNESEYYKTTIIRFF